MKNFFSLLNMKLINNNNNNNNNNNSNNNNNNNKNNNSNNRNKYSKSITLIFSTPTLKEYDLLLIK